MNPRSGVFVKVKPAGDDITFLLGDCTHFVKIYVEFVAEHVRPIDEQRDAGGFVFPAEDVHGQYF
jgi:hypothetical protein